MQIVHNATTHTAQKYTIMDLSIKPRTKCFDQNETSIGLLVIGRNNNYCLIYSSQVLRRIYQYLILIA
jgi:hypothetical protein